VTRTLLIDADVVAYEAAASKEVATHWGDGYWTWHCEESQVQAAVLDKIEEYREALDATDVKLCLTDSEGNFRFSVLPSYKGHRKATKKPLVLKAIKEWLIEEHEAYFRPGLEGDDCMGILATAKAIKGEKIIVSIDKDMKTIPGLYCRDLKSGVVEITEEEADYWHLYQTLIGDQTDGYKGCPGIGPKRASAVLDLARDHAQAKGHDFLISGWQAVLNLYEKAGLSPADALQQARVARILRASDYDFKKKEPILWQPPRT
jgi:DNA polymerase-1